MHSSGEIIFESELQDERLKINVKVELPSQRERGMTQKMGACGHLISPKEDDMTSRIDVNAQSDRI
jgi:hypothetical protein